MPRPIKSGQLIADIRNTPKCSPEVFESEWLHGRPHPNSELGSAALAGDEAINNWHYALEPAADGTDVIKVVLDDARPPLHGVRHLRWPTAHPPHIRDMTTTLNRIKSEVEAA